MVRTKRETPADAKELAQIEHDPAGAILEISRDGRPDRLGLRPRCLRQRQMHDDLDLPVGRQLSRPADDELFRVLIEILFAERKGIEL
jgi:hypothetical protein